AEPLSTSCNGRRPWAGIARQWNAGWLLAARRPMSDTSWPGTVRPSTPRRSRARPASVRVTISTRRPPTTPIGWPSRRPAAHSPCRARIAHKSVSDPPGLIPCRQPIDCWRKGVRPRGSDTGVREAGMILTDEQLLIQETARKFAQEHIAPHSGQWEREAAFPKGIFKELGALGFMGMTVPSDWGGAGADHVAYALALAEIAAGDGALSTVISGHNSVGVMPILNYGTEAQKRRYVRDLAAGAKLTAFCLTEPQGGSDAASIRTRAVRKGDSYVLSGTKQFITAGATADIALVIAVTDPEAGKRGITAFLVDTKAKGY